MNVRDLGIFFKGVWTCLKREMENAGYGCDQTARVPGIFCAEACKAECIW